MDNINAKMELLSLESRLAQFNELDFMSDLTNKGVANEIVTRLQLIGEKVSYIANQSFQIGKIILMKLWDFIKENPNLSIGFAIGLGLAILSGMIAVVGDSIIEDLITIVKKFWSLFVDIFKTLKNEIRI